MPKNAIQRLQQIENDIKTVISIYDVASKPSKDDTFETQKMRDSIGLSKVTDSSGEVPPNSGQISFLESLKKIGNFIPRPPRGINSRDSVSTPKKQELLKKPGSAPTSSSTISKICESQYAWPPLTDPNNGSKLKGEKGGLSKRRTTENLNAAERSDSGSFPVVYEVFMTPSRTIETANDILARNNFEINEGTEASYSSQDLEFYETLNKNDQDFEEIKSNKIDDLSNISERSSQTTESARCKKLPENVAHLESKSFAFPKTPIQPKKDKSTSEISARRLTPPKIQRVEKPKSLSQELKSGARFERKQSEEKDSKNWSCLNKMEGKSSGKVKSPQRSESKYTETSVRRQREESLQKERGEGKLEPEANEREQKDFPEPSRNYTVAQQTSSEANDPEIPARELFKKIEKSNEKLEKMKLSKELALDIAKQLKDKCDEIQQSKEEMMEKLQNAEKSNERLQNEVKDARESRKKLQLKMEGFRKESRTMLLEQDARTKELMDENAWLKARMNELEKKHVDQLLEKERQIEWIQRERLTEGRKELKSRDDRSEEVEKLTTERSELLSKIDELRAFLHSRHSKEETLEDKISRLQEEVQKQRQSLKKKTESLEYTNRELELIRQNSKDLEEQVKTLRSNIENLDQMHQNLVKQTIEYERQLKSQKEQIDGLQEEKANLKTQLENEKDSLLIKNKIIEDQQETIKQLREKSEEAKALVKKNQSLERILNVEREEKLELQEAVERLKWRKEDLKNKVKTLESDLLLAPQEVVRDLKKTQIVLHELENQVQIKQREWELHLQSLIKEKEQACSVAEFATKKLMQTTNEFQKQSEAQKRLHRALAENLAEKEKHLREAKEKVSLLQQKQIPSGMRSEEKIKSRPKDDGCDSDHEAHQRYPRNVAPRYLECRSKEAVSFTGLVPDGEKPPGETMNLLDCDFLTWKFRKVRPQAPNPSAALAARSAS